MYRLGRLSQQKNPMQVDSSMPRDIARGIASVKRFVRQHNIRGVHGTLIELIQCSNRLHTAIEVTCTFDTTSS